MRLTQYATYWSMRRIGPQRFARLDIAPDSCHKMESLWTYLQPHSPENDHCPAGDPAMNSFALTAAKRSFSPRRGLLSLLALALSLFLVAPSFCFNDTATT